MLTALLGALCICGAIYVVGGSLVRHSAPLAVPKSRFGSVSQGSPIALKNKQVFEGLRIASKKDKLDYNVFAKDSIARSLYWAGIRSSAAVKTIPLLMNVVLIAPLLLLGTLMAMRPISTNEMALIAMSGIIGYLMIGKIVKGKAAKRQAALMKDLPQFLDLLVVCVEAGQNFMAAIQTLTQEMDPKKPLIEEFIVLSQEYLGGTSMAEACSRFNQRCGVDNISVVIANVVQSEKFGTGLGNTLRVLAHEMRDKRRTALKEEANKMATKALFPCVLILVALMMVMLAPPMLAILKTFGGTS